MFGDDLIIRTRLIPPRKRRHLLKRPRLTTRLAESLQYPLTIVQAAAGYGKSTAISSFVEETAAQAVWYSAGETDANPLPFLVHLIHAFKSLRPDLGNRALALLEREDGPALAAFPAVEALINEVASELREETLVIIDDFHLVGNHPEILGITAHLTEHLPPNLHLILSTRHKPSLRGLARLRARSEVLEITERDLAFTPAEVRSLFHLHYGYDLTTEQAHSLVSMTEGWIIALQLVWQGLQKGADLAQLNDLTPESLEHLFDYLAQEVLARQAPHVQEFLIRTSVLRRMTPGACDAMLEQTGAQTGASRLLKELEENGLFLVDLGESQYRYHHLFGEFLNRTATKDTALWLELHRRAASHYRSRGDFEEAAHHHLMQEDFEAAAECLSQVAEDFIRTGRVDSVLELTSALPADVLGRYPSLLLRRGDALRLKCDFDPALAAYAQAEAIFSAARDRMGLSQALKGQAQVYLDTVQPARAEILLKKALVTLGRGDATERASLLKLMAENKTNQGQAAVAERLHQMAQEMLHDASRGDPDVRIHLRTGRLEAARALLERQARDEEVQLGPGRAPRSHRETVLLLSLIHSFMGDGEKARECAEQGIRTGQRLKSPFVEAVGYMRLGHAHQIGGGHSRESAAACYQKSLELSDLIRVRRGRAEPLMGLCLLHGFHGDIAAADRAGHEGLEIALAARDEWFAGVLRLSLGVAYAVDGKDARAREWLTQAVATLTSCGDSHGLCLTRLWLTWLHFRREEWPEFESQADALLQTAQLHGYDFLFTRRTLFGPRDPQTLIPMLIEAQRRKIRPDYVSWLLSELGLTEADSHPGYTLRIQTLGSFRIWRGNQEISPKEWQRCKARQLFQLLLTRRRELLPRDKILDLLWPSADPEAALRDFKVALNALSNVLEPHRSARSTPFYILRHGSAYGLNLASGYWLDADEFESLVARGNRLADKGGESALDLLQRALELYQGDYLQESPYEDWCVEERERLQVLYLRASERVAQMLARRGDCEACIEVCMKILAKDNCWEEAYRLLMTCYARLNNRPRALRTYEKCVEVLERELGIGPMPETVRLYERIRDLG